MFNIIFFCKTCASITVQVLNYCVDHNYLYKGMHMITVQFNTKCNIVNADCSLTITHVHLSVVVD
jgi:hypothetical protein